MTSIAALTKLESDRRIAFDNARPVPAMASAQGARYRETYSGYRPMRRSRPRERFPAQGLTARRAIASRPNWAAATGM